MPPPLVLATKTFLIKCTSLQHAAAYPKGISLPRSLKTKQAPLLSSRRDFDDASLDGSIENIERGSLASFGSGTTTDSENQKVSWEREEEATSSLYPYIYPSSSAAKKIQFSPGLFSLGPGGLNPIAGLPQREGRRGKLYSALSFSRCPLERHPS